MKSLCIARFCLAFLLPILPLSLFSQHCTDCLHLETFESEGDTNAIRQLIGQLAQQCPDSFFCLGYANAKMCRLHSESKQLEAAIAYGEEALYWRKKDSVLVKLTHTSTNLGNLYQELLEYDKAEWHYREALRYGDTLNDAVISSAQQGLGNVKMELGDYNASYEFYQLSHKKAVEVEDTYRRAQVLLGMGNLLRLMEKYRQGVDTLESAIRLFEALTTPDWFPGNEIGECRNNLGIIYKDGLQDYQKSAEQYRLGIALHADDVEKGKMQNNLGLAYLFLRDYPSAQRTLEQCLAHARKNGWSHVASLCLNNLGDLFLAQNNFLKALSHYHLAVRESVPGFSNADIIANPDSALLRQADFKKDYLLIFLADKAKGWLQFYRSSGDKSHLRHALDTYRVADEVVQLMRREQSMQGSKLFWRQKTRVLYESAIETCFLLGDHEQAFFFMERSKSVLLLDALSAIHARSLLPPALSSQEMHLTGDLLRVKQALAEALGTPGETAARHALLQKQQALDDFIEQLSGSHEAYRQIRFGSSLPSLTETREKFLRQDEALLHYFLGEKDLYALCIPKTGEPRFLQIPAQTLDRSLTPLLKILGEKLKKNYGDFVTLSHQLYSTIYAPLLPSGVRQVLIVPDSRLAFLPFEALVVNPAVKPGQIKAADFVIEKHTVRHAYSISALAMQQSLQRKSRRLLCLAPGFKDRRDGLAELAGSEEALGKLQFRHCKKLPDGNASKNRFLAEAPGYDILYLFTHASADTPCIQLADRPLFLSEMGGSSLVADLVVLAACETAYGEVARGEGVMSMASGFAYSGAASLVSSLWAVNEGSTAAIFSDFFNRLPAGTTKAEALRQAKLAYLEQPQLLNPQKNPYYWAAFVFFGSDNAVELEMKPWWEKWLPMAAMVLAVVGAGFWVRKRRRGKTLAGF